MMGTSSMIWTKLLVVLSCVSVAVWGYFPSYSVPYCNHNFNTRKIPPLDANQASLVKSLQQVQVVVRHGARTPYKKYQCWANYDVIWNNCNVTELMLESPSYSSQNRPATWLFRKIYNASPNYLGGNCFTGQLLLEGYDQEEANGGFLKQAYINDGPLSIFPTDQWMSINTTQFVYLRSDDEQRTLMSGQVLLHAMFNISEEIIVPWHTGDYGLDQIYPNSGVCPRLNTLSTEIYATNDFIKENTSAEIVTLSNNLDQILGQGQWSWNYIFDCMMTTVCTGRPIPDGNAATGVTMNDAIFNATINQVAFQESYLNLYSDSEWAKLAMGNTAWHIRNYLVNRMDNITGVATTTTDDWPNPFKFVLFSAHDTTLISLLAAICSKSWDRQWPGYASLLSIELYEAANSTPAAPKFLSRFVYNSKPLLVDGCPDTLCDTNIILNTLGFGQETMPGCSVPASNDDDNSNDCDDGGMTTTDWAITSCLTAALGMLIGAGIVVFTDKRRLNYSVYEDERKRDIEIKGTMSPLAVGPSV